jgi:hypothetical protein
MWKLGNILCLKNIAIIIAFGIGQPLCRNLIRVDNLKYDNRLTTCDYGIRWTVEVNVSLIYHMYCVICL